MLSEEEKELEEKYRTDRMVTLQTMQENILLEKGFLKANSKEKQMAVNINSKENNI